MNRYYDDIDLLISNTNLNLFGKHSLLHYLAYNEARKLYKKKDYDNAISISDKILENTDDEFLKYLCVSLIADIYQDKEDYKSAVEFFEKAYKTSRNFMHDMVIVDSLDKLCTKNLHIHNAVNRDYRMNEFHLIQYIELLNMAEMYCYLENKEKANECFRKLNEDIQSFSIPKKIHIILELTSLYGQHQELLRYRLYQKVVKLADSYENRMVDSIEYDIGKIIFSSLRFDNNSTKETCARKWIDGMKSVAISYRNKITTVPSGNEVGADLIDVYKDYESRFRYRSYSNKIDYILKASDLFSEISDVHSIVPTTIEPRKMINRIKYVMDNLVKIEGKENLKIDVYSPIANLGYQDVIQRLNLACSRCYYALDDFDAAENILREVIANSIDKAVLFNAHSILGISLIRNWDIRSGIKELEKAADMTDDNGVLFEYCMYELLVLDNKKIFFKVLDSIADKINSNPANKENYWDNGFLLATWQFNEFGLTEEAMHFINKGLSVENNELVRISLLEEKAYISFLDGDYDAAENILNEIFHISLSDKNTSAGYNLLCSSAWHKLSIICAKKHEFKKAVDYIGGAITSLDKCEDIDVKSEMESYSKLKEIYSIFLNHIIKFEQINIKEVIDIFKTADEIIYNGLEQNYNRSFDFKLALGEYGKGLETYMHDNISAHLRKEVLNNNDDKHADGVIWKEIPFDLKCVLGYEEDKTISLGQWKILIRDVFYGKYLFTWDDFSHKRDKLKEFLKQDHKIDWVENASFKTIDYATIKVYSEDNILLLELNDEKTEVGLKINDDKRNDLITKTEKNKLDVYSGTTTNSIKNPYVKESYAFIKDFMGEPQWDIVTEACAVVAPYRNDAAHYGTGTLEDALEVRGNIIEQINKVIDVMEQISIPATQ